MVSSHTKCSLFESKRLVNPKDNTVIPRSQYVVVSTYDWVGSEFKCVPSVKFSRDGRTYSEAELEFRGLYPDNI